MTFVPGDIEIPAIPMLIEDRGQTHADLELELSAVIWLPTPESARGEGRYKQYGDEIRRKAEVRLTDYIEVPASLLEPVEYEADLSEVPAWAFRYKPEVRCPRVRSVEGAARCGQVGG